MSDLERDYELKVEMARKSQQLELTAIELEHQIRKAKSDAEKDNANMDLEIEEIRKSQVQVINERKQLEIEIEESRKKAEADI